jgi:hypothetical protein
MVAAAKIDETPSFTNHDPDAMALPKTMECLGLVHGHATRGFYFGSDSCNFRMSSRESTSQATRV